MSDAETIAPAASATAATASGRQAPPATMTIFGAAGDLTKRLVMPALYNLVRAGRIPDRFTIIGVDISEQTSESWRDSLPAMLRAFVGAGNGTIDKQAWSWLTRRMRYLRGDFAEPETFSRLARILEERGRHDHVSNVLFYLAVADRFFGPIIDHLGRAGLAGQSGRAFRRVIVEKPFGHDLASAKTLNAQIRKVLSEDQIYRIDHFLGKETVQNIRVLRFANGIFEPLWNRDLIDHVQITAAETIGVEHRAARMTEIAVQFRQAPYALFRSTPVEHLPQNILTLRIQPDEGLSLSFSAKRPGAEIEIDGVEMNFAYRDYYAPLASVGYETLIYDCLIGDATLFQRADTVEAAWCTVQDVLDQWARVADNSFPNYAAGSVGPDAADRLLARDGRAWLPIRPGQPHGKPTE